jgi:hypothetical protein
MEKFKLILKSKQGYILKVEEVYLITTENRPGLLY